MDKVKQKLHNLAHSHSKSEDDDGLTPAQRIAEEARAAEGEPLSNDDAVVIPELEGVEVGKEREKGDNASASAVSVKTSQTNITARMEARRANKFSEEFDHVIEPGEELIASYAAALGDSVLIQGYLYVSTKHVAFTSDIIGLKRRIIQSYKDMTSVQKKSTLKIIPNALTIEANGETHTFTSLLSREATYELILGQWKENNLDGYNAFVAKQGEDGDEDLDAMEKVPKGTHPATKSDSKPLSEIALDVRLPTTPEKAYGLIWKDGDFIKKFMENTMKLKDVKISEWDGEPPKRRYSYIKPLNNSVGPKETDCSLNDEEKHADPETYYEHFTITKTPNVPSGDSFEIHTQTVISWAGGAKGGCKVFVTTEVVWSGRSMLKGVITKASVDGQKDYHKELIKEVRAFIKEHAAEYADGDTGDTDADDEVDEDDTKAAGGLMDTFSDLLSDPVKMVLAILVVILLTTNAILFLRLRSARTIQQPAVKLDASAAERLKAVEDFIKSLKNSIAST